MAYTDDAVKAKLSALNETQESIVTVAQWVMFHRYGNFPGAKSFIHSSSHSSSRLTSCLQETR